MLPKIQFTDEAMFGSEGHKNKVQAKWLSKQ